MTQIPEFGQPAERTDQKTIPMPAATCWPMVLAFGVALLFMGLVTSFYLSLAGLVMAVCAAIGWWHEVIPVENEEPIAIQVLRRPGPVRTEAERVDGAHADQAGGRLRYPERVHPYKAGLLGGLAGGAAMAVLACAYGLVAQHSLWYPLNLLAGVVLPYIGSQNIAQLRAFQPIPFVAAVLGHICISLMVGLVYAVMLPMFPRFAPFWAGVLMPLVWSGLIATTLQILDPALTARISWLWFVLCQFGFGLVCGFAVSRTTTIPTAEWWGRAQHG